MWGRPLGTGPRIETPCALRSKIQLTAIAPTTATRPPGIALIQRSNTISVASTASETASVAPRGLADLLERVPELDHACR